MTIFDDFSKAHKEVLNDPRYGVSQKWRQERNEMNPSLDYLFEFPVNSVQVKKDGSGYAIEFERDGAIVGIEGENPEAPDLVGKALITVIRSDEGNTLIFGHRDQRTNEIKNRSEVKTTPGKYFIIDPRFGGETFYPDTATVETADQKAATIREQFEGRFADGPDARHQASADAQEALSQEDTLES